MDAERARLAISLVDLTNLADDCDEAAIEVLCDRAVRAGTAAVCVWPDFVGQAAARLERHPITVATVVNFPTGDERPFATRALTERALDDGADEIDVVLPYRRFAAGDRERADAVLSAVRSATDGRALMKVILETGELAEPSTISAAATFAIDHGADFVKTSTGKTKVSATPDAARVMLEAIAAADRTVGLKPSGGIGSAADADTYLGIAESVMGADFLQRRTFRFGASGVLDSLLEAAGESDVAGASSDGY